MSAPRPVAVGVRALEPEDWPAVRAIYAEGIATGDATFETAPPDTFAAWSGSRLAACRLVAHAPDAPATVLGWAALTPVSSRPAYSGVAEVAVYVAAAARGRRVGTALLRALVAASESHGIWTLQSAVFPENAATRRLHAACGFREVGRRERIGVAGGRWRDTLLLERRSQLEGLPAASGAGVA